MTKGFFSKNDAIIFLIFIAIFMFVKPAQAQIQNVTQGDLYPRLASLKYNEVNGRVGPSMQHKILWQYQRTSLPVLITASTSNWYRIEDPLGGVSWVHKRLIKEAPTFQIRNGRENGKQKKGVTLHKEPSSSSAILARIERGVVVRAKDCVERWCKVRVRLPNDKIVSGWVGRHNLWGANWYLSSQTG